MGRPSDYCQETAAEICGRLAGGESLFAICKAEEMPGLTTVYRWLQEKAEFRELYARAREDQADTLADEILAIADEDPATITFEDKQGNAAFQVDGAAIQHQKLRIDSRKWIASKLKPKRYGDKVDLTHGSDPDRPLISRVVREIVEPQSPDR